MWGHVLYVRLRYGNCVMYDNAQVRTFMWRNVFKRLYIINKGCS